MSGDLVIMELEDARKAGNTLRCAQLHLSHTSVCPFDMIKVWEFTHYHPMHAGTTQDSYLFCKQGKSVTEELWPIVCDQDLWASIPNKDGIKAL